MEELRKKGKITTIVGSIISTIIVGCLAVLFYDKIGYYAIPFFIIAWIVLVGICISAPARKINKLYKTIYVKEVFEKRGLHFNPGVYYGSKEDIISEKDFYDSLFVDRTHDNDFIAVDGVEGKCQDIPFKSVDVDCSFTTGSSNNMRKVYLFWGRFYQIERNIDLGFVLLIKERDDSYNYGLTEIEFESIRANKLYKFYTNDEHRAFYHVKPDTLEDLMQIAENHKGKLFLSIANGKIYAGRSCFNQSFEYNKNATEESINAEIDEELSFIESVIKCFVE